MRERRRRGERERYTHGSGGELRGLEVAQIFQSQSQAAGEAIGSHLYDIQETLEGNSNRSTVGRCQDFLDCGRRWGTDKIQWDDILHHLMGITAAMEVWPSQTPGSSSPLDGEENHTMEEEPIVDSCSKGGDDSHEELNATEENLQAGNTGETEAHADQQRKKEE